MKYSLESAVRMNIVTGINQTAAQATMNNCAEVECDLVETSAHAGTRPSHADWQGQIFSLSGKDKRYRPFSVCGLGKADGICGINCRHSYYPYFDGMERHYDKEALDALKKKEYEYNGEKLTRYEAEQKLRKIERQIRRYKKRVATFEAAGLQNPEAKAKLGEWQAVARDFTKQTGLRWDYAREYIGVERNLFNQRQAQPRGTGTKEKYVKTAKDTSIQTASDIKKDDDIVDYFINKYNADTKNRLAFMDIDNVKAFNKGFEDMQKELGVNISLNSVSTTKGGIASYAYGGKLNFNTNDFATKEALKKIIEEEIKSGYFGKDTTPEILGRHEMAHGVEEILIKRRFKTESEREYAWDNCTIAEEIVKKAYRNLQAMGETKELDDLKKEISGYANDNFPDGLAECLARKSNDKKSLIYQVWQITIKMLRGSK